MYIIDSNRINIQTGSGHNSLPVCIIGTGISGLSAAALLQHSGRTVVAFEKNAEVGGKMASLNRDGFSFDLGPTLFTMPFVLQDLLTSVGALPEEYPELIPVDPACRYFWSDGTVFNAYGNDEQFIDEIARVFPQDVDAVRTFLRHIARLYEITAPVFILNRFDGMREFFKPRNLPLLTKLHLLEFSRTVSDSLSRRFRSPKLIQFFERFTTYNGSDPRRARATLNVIPHVELAFGAWYPKGGMSCIPKLLRGVCNRSGVVFRTGESVERVVRSGRRIDEVCTDTMSIPVQSVVSTADVLQTYRKLLQPVGIHPPKTLSNAERSSSGFLVTAAVNGTHDALAHHNVLFSDDYPNEFEDIFVRKRMPVQPTIYISISAKSDSDMAPPGCENWYMLVNAPHSTAELVGEEPVAEYTELVWNRMREFGLQPDIRWESALTPFDIQQRYGGADGAIYGSSSNSMLSAFLRPRAVCPGLDNMFFAGGSAHPGGGVPLCMISGTIAAQELLRRS